MSIPARLSIVTVGARDLTRSVAFYEALGWERCTSSQEGVIAWFRMAGSYVGVFGWDALREDAGLAGADGGRWGGITLAMNVASEPEVGAGLDAAVAAGATLLKPATRADWGGLSGYFADPDGHPWEIAFNPFFPLDAEGQITIP